MFLMFFLRSKAVKRREIEQHFENLGIRNSQLPNWVAMWMLEPWSETEISALEDNDMLTKVFFCVESILIGYSYSRIFEVIQF